MKKLFFSIVSLMISASAFAEYSFDNAYWIVKDGKLTDNVTYLEYDPEDLGAKVPNELTEATVDGEEVVIYKQISKNFLDVNLKFNESNPLDFSKNYVLMLEYKIPASHKDTLICEGNKPLWMFGFATTADNLHDKNVTHAESYCFIDAKWGETDKWVTTYKYMYAPASMNELYGMNFTYAREYISGDLTEFPCIKNMAFVSIKEGKPFYSENFDGYDDLDEFYTERLKFTKRKILQGGINPVITDSAETYMTRNKEYRLTLFRDYLSDSLRNQDGSGYIDCEQLRALQVEPIRDSIVFPDIKIPAGAEKIYSQMLIKKHKNERATWKDEDLSIFTNTDLPILVKFNTGEIVDLANDTIKLIWTKFNGEVSVPKGATSFDLIFKGGTAGFLVDDILLSSSKIGEVGVENIGADAFEIVAYVDENGDIVVENGEIVAVYNVDGRIASKNDKAVVVVVKNEKGQLASKVMIRK